MFTKTLKIVFILILAAQWSGCSTSRALIKYDNLDSDVKASPNSFSGKVVGPVHGDEGGAVWTNCTEKATESVKVMLAQAKDMGANVVGDIKWRATGDGTPSCKKGWGYVLLWPFLLTPLFMSTAVDGTAYNVDGGVKKKTGFYVIPGDKLAQEELAKQIIKNL